MNDSNRNNESVILKIGLKNLYSYSKQSLAPAVSTVGFSFNRCAKFCISTDNECHKNVSSDLQLTHISHRLMDNSLFLSFGQNLLKNRNGKTNGKKS
jgi:hypothetical protein